MREHEAQRRPGAIDQLRHQRHEIVPVGAKPVKPHHREARIGSGFGFHARKGHGAHGQEGRTSLPNRHGFAKRAFFAMEPAL